MRHDYIKHKFLLVSGFLAVLFVILGLFLNIWWSSGHSEDIRTFGLWERVQCTQGVCRLTTGAAAGKYMAIELYPYLTVQETNVLLVFSVSFERGSTLSI